MKMTEIKMKWWHYIFLLPPGLFFAAVTLGWIVERFGEMSDMAAK